MNNNRCIFVAGHNGLAGKAVCKALIESDPEINILTATHCELDLEDAKATFEFFKKNTPTEVVVCAAKVGGIIANSTFPHDFLNINLKIQTSVFDAAHAHHVKKLIFLGSSCIYPRDCPQPISEDYLLTGSLEPTNRPYAIAKIAGIESVWAYNKQFGYKWLSLMPTNLFGHGDNYHPEHSHVLPALLRRMHEAKTEKKTEVVVWGSGNPRREFMFADDLGDAVAFLLTHDELEKSKLFSDKAPPILNVGTGSDMSISELAIIIKEIVGYEGNVIFDKNKPDGTPQKLLDVTKINSLGWIARSNIKTAMQLTYKDFLSKSTT